MLHGLWWCLINLPERVPVDSSLLTGSFLPGETDCKSGFKQNKQVQNERREEENHQWCSVVVCTETEDWGKTD